ncbi:anaerobic ribonucleoside-triphosphate reductase-activating protein [Hallella multisaccharivorax DSM 17128]|uniref:Anaerobic ribonucleoside-triphosphate reductase-activating protein n=1 Tax=Hallella multisaccharivorax DSM 17128 TaxID=688246 RepID=F8NAE8_9BACT|nr:anaerobic ribonucleoside-triphosphate reductase activating protein [Hallella multisaccharivorax]EGN57828.1 ribonucleoside-triphosphate reductase class III activase subunit [Hallella multisaccharivorax DSM 17128]GJG30905.1 anaerobic ribonucleoside-triphosphate reductase-activating protein [Hallella multisaccharivorax DSM 17128]
MRIFDITSCDVNNGEGLRVTLWVAGCSHHCKGCQNPQTWDFQGGRRFDQSAHDYLFSELSKPYIQGITFSGGDPLCSPDDVAALAKEIKESMPGKDIWVYTGFTIEQIEADPKLRPILNYADVIVDGEYVEALRDVTLAFRGSRNQRVIRLKDGKIIKKE